MRAQIMYPVSNVFLSLNVSFYTFHGSWVGNADKSLARSGRKQATATEDFDVHISYLLS